MTSIMVALPCAKLVFKYPRFCQNGNNGEAAMLSFAPVEIPLHYCELSGSLNGHFGKSESPCC